MTSSVRTKGRRHEVDVDLVRRPLRRELFAEDRHTAFRGSVGGIATPSETELRTHGPDVHLFSAALCDDVPRQIASPIPP